MSWQQIFLEILANYRGVNALLLLLFRKNDSGASTLRLEMPHQVDMINPVKVKQAKLINGQ